MTEKGKKITSMIRILTFIVVGAMNTLWLRPEAEGTWKNYLGYFFLFLALVEMIMRLVLWLNRSRRLVVESYVHKAIAVLLPFYFVYLPQLHNDPECQEIKVLWKYVFIGFFLYLLGLILYLILR